MTWRRSIIKCKELFITVKGTCKFEYDSFSRRMRMFPRVQVIAMPVRNSLKRFHVRKYQPVERGEITERLNIIKLENRN